MDTAGKEAIADQVYKKAVSYEIDYGCCPQCVLAALQETVGIIDDNLIKASHGLSGGGGLMGQGTCGALSGGLLALGARRGRDRNSMHRGRGIANFHKGRELVELFRQEFKGITCEDLQKNFTGRTYDMWNPDEYAQFGKERGMKCAHAAGMVARWVYEML